MSAKVTCVMPTRNRPEFVAQSVRYFLRQDYSPKELVIIDDGEEAAESWIPQSPEVRYFHLTQPTPIGVKRNLACEWSSGEFIAHWDDDDWFAPGRLRRQVEQLQSTGTGVCGMIDLLYYAPELGEAWMYRAPRSPRRWLAGCTIMYRRSVWEKSAFPAVDIGEDSLFLQGVSEHDLAEVADPSLTVGLLHSRNAAPKNLSLRCWEPRPLAEALHLISGDREFYVRLRNGFKPRANPAPAVRKLTVAGSFLIHEGYGSMSEYLALGMARAGSEINLEPLNWEPSGLASATIELKARSQPWSSEPVLYHGWPNALMQRYLESADLFVYSMWEASRLPAGWVDAFNRARCVIVPTRFVARVFKESGVQTPVEVVPLGVDPEVYPYIERPHRHSHTTLMVGTVVSRKHVNEGVTAWKLAFECDSDARLIIKTTVNFGNYQPDDSRIMLAHSVDRERGILKWYREADVLMALGSEGFGLPMVEAMAVGLPVIALSSEGQGDVCEDAPGCLLPVAPASWEDVREDPHGYGGVRGVPDVEQAAAHLRWTAEHPCEARAMGLRASAWVHRNRNIWETGPRVVQCIEKHLRQGVAIRRVPQIWATSLDRICGISEHAKEVCKHLPDCRVSAEAGQLYATRVLHVEHEGSLIDDATMLETIRRARGLGVRTAVTIHTVEPSAKSWEDAAEGLIALTPKGADALRRRHPGKPVMYAPVGCPQWRPAARGQGGRAVAVFGFLEHYKGFHHVVEALDKIPGAELLALSHPKSSSQEKRWMEIIDGRPVRWVRDFLPAEETVERLRLEADAIVFWYDDVPFAAASGAARMALASGVPVLASKTNWFSGMEEAIYQPESLATGLQHLLEDGDLRMKLLQGARDHCQANTWRNTAVCYKNLWRMLESN